MVFSTSQIFLQSPVNIKRSNDFYILYVYVQNLYLDKRNLIGLGTLNFDFVKLNK